MIYVLAFVGAVLFVEIVMLSMYIAYLAYVKRSNIE